MAETTVTVRMYNVGFGDAFLVTVRRAANSWRMLVDCGVHTQGQARPLRESVDAIITDLAGDDGATPRLDVIIATHHHADHIAGFALDAWESVEVGEVWVPFVEDETDSDAKQLRKSQTDTARRLVALLDARTLGVDPGQWPADVAAARAFAMNSSGNEDATSRLLGRNGLHFATTPTVRYLPSADEAENVISTSIPGVEVHVLGPPRSPEMLKRMNPPAKAGWLALDFDRDVPDGTSESLFPETYIMGPDEVARHPQLTSGHQALRHLDRINDGGVLAAASILERAVNNTSIFFVLDVDGTHLVFPGDAQQGAWDHVLENPGHRALVSDVAFFKIGHHGSHNGTPKQYVETVLHNGTQAMLPWGLVRRWQDTIPKTELLEALAAHNHHVTRADAPVAIPGKIVVHDDLWSELTLSIP